MPYSEPNKNLALAIANSKGDIREWLKELNNLKRTYKEK
jgi:hypothetical protein